MQKLNCWLLKNVFILLIYIYKTSETELVMFFNFIGFGGGRGGLTQLCISLACLEIDLSFGVGFVLAAASVCVALLLVVV
jgi:hypothetical protein